MLGDIAEISSPGLDFQHAFSDLAAQAPSLHFLDELSQGVDVFAKLMLDLEELRVDRLLKEVPVPCLP